MKIFIDTWAWVALVDRRDTYHDDAVRTYRKHVLKETAILTTSDYVLSETMTTLRPIVGHPEAVLWLSKVLEEIERKTIHLVSMDIMLWRKAFDLLKRYDDKPDISFVDFTSFVVMQELNITNVFTGDKHFEQVNLGFRLLKET